MKSTNRLGAARLLLALALLASNFSLAIAQTAAPAAQPANNEYQEGAILWTQTSGEARALAYQAFALARMVLDRDLRMNRRSRVRRAVVVDVDETVLDNSAFQATLLMNRQGYDPRLWTDWV